jgi:uncharacterized BrkB/YihY/UPF0761 family membrane protein
MLVVYILGGLLCLAGVYFGVRFAINSINEHCDRKFGHEFLTMDFLYICTFAYLIFFCGRFWYSHALQTRGDTLNGIIVMILGILIFLFIIFLNVRSSNYVYGILGSVVQIALFGILFPVVIGGFFSYIFLKTLFLFLMAKFVPYVRVVK